MTGQIDSVVVTMPGFGYNKTDTITAGNAGNILVLIDNNVRGKIGKQGEVVDSLYIDNKFNN